jgi:hypothetical protein
MDVNDINNENEANNFNKVNDLSDNNISVKRKVTYVCYDCGGIWDKDGVDIYQTKDLTKYVCKECRGRCIPKHEIGKVKGVKSIRQRYRNGRITLVLLIIILAGISLNIYNRRVRINDYKDYLQETVALRTIINAKLKTYGQDYNLIQEARKKKITNDAVEKAQDRVAEARKFISARDADIENIKKPETPEVFELYTAETTFWRDPSLTNYMRYRAVFNHLIKKYGHNYFDQLKERVRKSVGKK